MKNFNKKIMIITGIVIIFLVLFFKFRVPEKEPTVVARINDKKISYNEYKEFISEYENLNKLQRIRAIDILIHQKIIMLYAEKNNIFKEQFASTQKKEKEIKRRSLLADYYLQFHANQKVDLSKEEMADFYKNNKFYNLYLITAAESNPKASFILNSIKTGFAVDRNLEKLVKKKLKTDLDNFYVGCRLLKNIKKNYPEISHHVVNLQEEELSDIFELDIGHAMFYRSKDLKFKKAKNYVKVQMHEIKSKEYKKKLIKEIKDELLINHDFLRRLPYIPKQKLSQPNIQNELILSVGNKKLFFSDFQKIVPFYYFSTDLSLKTYENLKNTVELIGLEIILSKKSLENNLHEKRDFKLKLKKTFNQIERKYDEKTIQYILEKKENQDYKIDNQTLKNYYIKHKNEFRKSSQFRLQQIIFDNLETAEKTYQKLKKNKITFEQAVLDFSLEENKSFTKGIIGYLDKDDLENKYQKIISYKKGQITQPIKIEDNKIAIYKILDIQQGPVIPFERVRSKIYDKLIFEKNQEWVNKLIDKYDLKVERYYDEIS